MRSIIRRDPNVLGVAELPDQATAKEIVKADFDRVRVYVCLRAGGGIEAIQGWLKAVGDAESAVKNLRGVVSQRLLRKVCTNCRVPYQPSPDMLKKLGLPADKVKQLVKKGGQVLVKNKPEVCPVCQGIGYVGQEAVFEVYVIDAEERELIKASDWNGLRAALRKKGAASIQQAAIRKAADGSTTIEEVMRVTTDAAPAAKA